MHGALAGLVLAALAACSPGTPSATSHGDTSKRAQVTVSGDDEIAKTLTWDIPQVQVGDRTHDAVLAQADAAVVEGRLFADGGSAIPLYLLLLKQVPADPAARAGLDRALAALLAQGDTALVGADDDIEALRQAHRIAAVARIVAPDNKDVAAYLGRIDQADQAWDLNRQAELDLRRGQLGEAGAGALTRLQEVLRLRPDQARAMQGLAAVESAFIRRAELSAQAGDFTSAARWLVVADTVRPGSDTIVDARRRIDELRTARVVRLHDDGMRALLQHGGIAIARTRLDEMLRIAAPGDVLAADLRERIDLVTHYGLFHPGQHFTDALRLGARGPEMVVIPHGAFRMGAVDDAANASDVEKPAHYVRFDHGFAMAQTEVTVEQFGDFIRSTGYRTTAARRGNALVYDERSGNFVRRGGVDWQSAYDGSRAPERMPVAFVSARDAVAYVEWLATQSGQRYRLPSEAEFEYALRAGTDTRYPWGDGAPPPGFGNLTGGKDMSPSGRHWSNAFAGYGDGAWGPATVGQFQPNAFGLHDIAGNVSEWVADCWHDSYRRAPDDGAAWVNPGCASSVVRGGSWASSPEQTRSTWRAAVGVETANARIGFRVVRDID